MADEGNGIVAPIKSEEKRNPSWFQPGNNANPLGRPKKAHAITDLIREKLDRDPELRGRIVDKLLAGASKGDIAFLRELIDRLEGKPLQSIESKDVTELSLSYGHSKPDESPAKAGGSDTNTSKPEV